MIVQFTCKQDPSKEVYTLDTDTNLITWGKDFSLEADDEYISKYMLSDEWILLNNCGV